MALYFKEEWKSEEHQNPQILFPNFAFTVLDIVFWVLIK